MIRLLVWNKGTEYAEANSNQQQQQLHPHGTCRMLCDSDDDWHGAGLLGPDPRGQEQLDVIYSL